MSDATVIEEWDSDAFHRRVMELQAEGYATRDETYRITPVMNPETGRITHVYRIEMYKPDEGDEP